MYTYIGDNTLMHSYIASILGSIKTDIYVYYVKQPKGVVNATFNLLSIMHVVDKIL